MLQINVENLNTAELNRMYRNLSPQQIAAVTADAINRTLMKGRTVARNAVKKVYNIPQKNLSGVNINRARRNYLQGSIYASTKPIPMDAFSPRFDLVSGGVVRGVQRISRRGISSSAIVRRRTQQLGVSIEVKKGDRTVVPYAFMLPGAKPRVFARGEYKSGSSYGFIQRHTRQANSQGNDSVKPLVSVTVFSAVINPQVKNDINNVIVADYERNALSAIRRRVRNA